MHRLFGEMPDKRCAECKHFISGEYHDRRLFKCELYGLTHSEATDWRKSYTACGLYNMHVKRSLWVDVLTRLKWGNAPKAPRPVVDGQIEMEV
jgi:hypothetical protein